MNVGIVSTHAWPIPNAARTGDIYVLDLAIALQALGHNVTMFSPAGTAFPNVLPMQCSGGTERPGFREAEIACLQTWGSALDAQDVVHDISTGKTVGTALAARGRPVCMTLNGGPWRDMNAPINLIVHSRSQRERVLRGATDFDGTRMPEMGGPRGIPIRDAHVVLAGVDTSLYAPTDYAKDDYVLWLNRWHPAKGCAVAIAWAKANPSQRVVIAGENPANETQPTQAAYALEMARLAEGLTNVNFVWLPAGNDHDVTKIELYRRARCLLYMAQFQEPFGLSQVEVLACGTPIVGTRYGSVPEIVREGVTGYVVSDDVALMTSISAAVESAQDLSPQACRADAVARFDRSVMADGYLAQYEAILGGASW